MGLHNLTVDRINVTLFPARLAFPKNLYREQPGLGTLCDQVNWIFKSVQNKALLRILGGMMSAH